MWIPRELDRVLTRPSLPVRVLVGPRQAGKSTLLARLLPGAAWLSLDDLQVRHRAQSDPALLIESVGTAAGRPIIFDEAAQAPNLFPEIKRRVDEARRRGDREPEFWMTGSHEGRLSASCIQVPITQLAERLSRVVGSTLTPPGG